MDESVKLSALLRKGLATGVPEQHNPSYGWMEFRDERGTHKDICCGACAGGMIQLGKWGRAITSNEYFSEDVMQYPGMDVMVKDKAVGYWIPYLFEMQGMSAAQIADWLEERGL